MIKECQFVIYPVVHSKGITTTTKSFFKSSYCSQNKHGTRGKTSNGVLFMFIQHYAYKSVHLYKLLFLLEGYKFNCEGGPTSPSAWTMSSWRSTSWSTGPTGTGSLQSQVERGKQSDDLREQDQSSLQWREVNSQMNYGNRIKVVSSGER